MSDNSNTPKLTAKQAAFCAEYLIDLNAAQAAIRAGYSEATAKEIGFENLTKPHIQLEVQKLMAERGERTEITADAVLRELLKVARVDIGEAFNDDGGLKSMKDIPENVRRAIAGVDVLEEFAGRGEDRVQIGYTKKLRFWDKIRALELLGRHLRLFTDKMEVTGKDGGPLLVQDPRPAPAAVAEFSAALFKGFREYRSPTGESANLEESMEVLVETVADYAAAGNAHGCGTPPERLGELLATGAVCRKNIVPPASFRGVDREF